MINKYLCIESMHETSSHKWLKEVHILSVCIELRHDCINVHGSSHPFCTVGEMGVPVAQTMKQPQRKSKSSHL